MMDCKAALIESDGDNDKAIEILRKKGQKIAAKRADREASEGIILAKTNDTSDFGALIIVNSETDFVAKSDDFINYAKAVIDLAVSKKPSSTDELKALNLNGRTVEQNLMDLVGKIGEWQYWNIATSHSFIVATGEGTIAVHRDPPRSDAASASRSFNIGGR